jgi:hypothetical protein
MLEAVVVSVLLQDVRFAVRGQPVLIGLPERGVAEQQDVELVERC